MSSLVSVFPYKKANHDVVLEWLRLRCWYADRGGT